MSRRTTLLAGWALAITGVALFVALGLWQSRRALDKEAVLAEAAATVADRSANPLSVASDPARAGRIEWASGPGEFTDAPALLLDNQQRGGRVGVRAYRIFQPASGGPLLVDLGWLPLPPDRTMPAVERPQGTVTLSGLVAPPPSSGIPMGEGVHHKQGHWLLTRIDIEAITAATELQRGLAPRVLRLDPALPIGYDRDLEVLANTLSPDKHRGYALQWFGLAVTALVIALVLTFRRRRGSNKRDTHER